LGPVWASVDTRPDTAETNPPRPQPRLHAREPSQPRHGSTTTRPGRPPVPSRYAAAFLAISVS
jgi:hypothetical protein